MRMTIRIVLASALIGAAVADGKGTANAQYYYPPPPPYGYGYGGQTWNGCPPGYTVQGGSCAPYRGPVGGGWRGWNGYGRRSASPMVWLLNSRGRRLSSYPLVGLSAGILPREFRASDVVSMDVARDHFNRGN
jgi:hypothetical protein